MKRLSLLLILVAGFSTTLCAQKYGTAIGLRVQQDAMGLTLQQRLFAKQTVEAAFALNKSHTQATVTLQRHFGIGGPRFNIYAGVGAHMGATTTSFSPHEIADPNYYGVSGVVGVELKLWLLPLVVSLDYMPHYSFGNLNGSSSSTALSARFVLFH